MKKILMGGLASLMLLGAASAHAEGLTAEEQIKTRKAGYSFMAWNMGKIKAQVIDGSVPYNASQVQAAANAIEAIANSGMSALYGPDTAQKQGEQTTRLKPEFFNNLEEAGRLGRNLSLATVDLQAAAQTADPEAIKKAFGKVGQACKACHDKFREE